MKNNINIIYSNEVPVGAAKIDTQTNTFTILINKNLTPEEKRLVLRHELCHIWRQDILAIKLFDYDQHIYNIASDAIINQWLLEDYPHARQIIEKLNGVLWEKEKEYYGEKYPPYNLGTGVLYEFYRKNIPLNNNQNTDSENDDDGNDNPNSQNNQKQNSQSNKKQNPSEQNGCNSALIDLEQATIKQINEALEKALKEIKTNPEYADITKFNHRLITFRRKKITEINRAIDKDIEKVCSILKPLNAMGQNRDTIITYMRRHPTIKNIPRKIPRYFKEGRLIVDISGSMNERAILLLKGVMARINVECFVFSDTILPLNNYKEILHGGTYWNPVKKFLESCTPRFTVIVTDEEWLDSDAQNVRNYCAKHNVKIYNIHEHRFEV